MQRVKAKVGCCVAGKKYSKTSEVADLLACTDLAYWPTSGERGGANLANQGTIHAS